MKKMTTLEMVMCGLFVALIAIGAFIQIPVPGYDYFTLQFLFVLMAGMLLGAQKGMIATGVYVLLGLFGLPVFAAGGGFSYILRPSFGYLIGFVAAAYVVGKVCEGNSDNHYKKYMIAAFLGFLVTYGIGLSYKYFMLNLYLGEKTALVMVVLDAFPLDMPGDFVLCLIAAGLAVKLVPVIQRSLGQKRLDEEV